MKELYLVRHGRTLFNEKGLIQGWCDSPLTSLGEEQAGRIGRYLRHEGIAFDHACASTLTRTQRTLERIVDMPYERFDGLREWGFGMFEAEHVNLMPAFPWGDFYQQFGGEGQLEVRERMMGTLRDIMERPGCERVIAVSHGSSCREFLTAVALESGTEPPRAVPGNCSVMRFSYENSAFALEQVLEQDDLRRVLGE